MPSPRPPMTGSVKVIPGNHGPNKNVNEMLKKGFNKEADTIALRRKSGELAKTRASQVDVGTPKKVIPACFPAAFDGLPSRASAGGVQANGKADGDLRGGLCGHRRPRKGRSGHQRRFSGNARS